MKRITLLFGVMLLGLCVLAACSSNTDNNQEDVNDEVNNEQTNVIDENNATEEDVGNTSNEVPAEDSEADSDVDISSNGTFEDQTDLKIGDTGKADSTLGQYEITIDSVKVVDELDDEVSMFDHIFIAEVTIKNIGDKAIDARETVSSLEITDDLEGAGAEDTAEHFDSVEAFSGTIEPGETLKGESVFEARDSDTYYIRTVSGLIASGAVINETTWTFTMDDVEK